MLFTYTERKPKQTKTQLIFHDLTVLFRIHFSFICWPPFPLTENFVNPKPCYFRITGAKLIYLFCSSSVSLCFPVMPIYCLVFYHLGFKLVAALPGSVSLFLWDLGIYFFPSCVSCFLTICHHLILSLLALVTHFLLPEASSTLCHATSKCSLLNCWVNIWCCGWAEAVGLCCSAQRALLLLHCCQCNCDGKSGFKLKVG